jgi:hypothetical protein
MSNKGSGGLYYFTMAMTAVYVLLGIYIMVSGSIENLLPGNKKYIIGTLLILYAAYRAYRLFRINRNMQNPE